MFPKGLAGVETPLGRTRRILGLAEAGVVGAERNLIGCGERKVKSPAPGGLELRGPLRLGGSFGYDTGSFVCRQSALVATTSKMFWALRDSTGSVGSTDPEFMMAARNRGFP